MYSTLNLRHSLQVGKFLWMTDCFVLPILSFRNENFYFGYPAAILPFKLDVLEADTASLGLQVTIT